MGRRLRSAISALLSLSVFASVLVLATQADGREATLAESNDGGAWLIDRDHGGSAHVERRTRQATSDLVIAEPGSEISAVQSVGIIAIYDRSASAVSVINGDVAAINSTTTVPLGSVVWARPGGVTIFDPTTARLWDLAKVELASVASVEDVPAAYAGVAPGQAPGMVVVGSRGDVAVIEDSTISWPTGAGGPTQRRELPEGFAPTASTAAGSRVVLTDSSRWLVASPDGIAEIVPSRPVTLGALQQPADSWPLVAAVQTDGAAIIIDLSTGAVSELGGGGAGSPNTEPIFHDGCIHSLSGEAGAVEFLGICRDGHVTVVRELAIGPNAELRLVNGFVWIDALDGSGFVVTPELELEAIADFSEVFEDADGEESVDGTEVEERLDQSAEDAALTEADRLDLAEDNRPPIAQDDEAATRDGRPVVVDVLANDSDPNGDVLLVTEAVVTSGQAIIEIPAGRNGVQITPTGGSGPVTARYTISDGHPGGQASADITLDVLPLTAENNRPPEPRLDRATGAAGSLVALNLIDNDHDPDGDSLILTGVAAASSEVEVVSMHPGGDVIVLLPEDVGEGSIDVTYTVEDEWQAVAEGRLQVVVRLAQSNTPPDARNDAGVTVVGRRITLNLLANDVDADNDLLAIGQNARSLDPEFTDFIATTEDGEFTFEPTRAGTFYFEYSATDRQASDRALVRIDVAESTANRPPVAVRDDATLALGETRLIRALENDGDVDGDLVGIIDSTDNDHLDIVEQPGVGFLVTLRPSAGPVETFIYRLSDGRLESEAASVVVTRSNITFTDAAPVAIDDAARVRPGRTSSLQVLRNDFDPEGGPLRITDVAPTTDEVEVGVGALGQTIEVQVPPLATRPFAVTYTVIDEAGNSAAATVEVAIVQEGEENLAPIARPDVAYTTAEQAVTIPVLDNDTDPEHDPIQLVSIPLAPRMGSAVVGEDNLVRYTPHPGFTGTDTFTYLVRDSEGAESVGFVRIGVMPNPTVNRPPVAQPDLDYRFEAGAGRQPLRVLVNDFDPDGDPLRITSVTGSDAVLIADNARSLLFDVPASVSGGSQLFRFVYEISDGRGGSDSAEVAVLVESSVDPVAPVARPDTHGPVRVGEVVTIDVLANDSDPDGEVSALTLTTAEPGVQVANRMLVLTAPEASIDFRYRITDPDGLFDETTVTLLVQENLPPLVQSPVDLGEHPNDEDLVIDLTPYASDPDGDELTFANVAGAVGGTPRLDAGTRDARRVTFIPSAGHQGPAGFTYTVEDPFGHQVTGRITFTLVGPVNVAPVAVPATPIELEAGRTVPIDFAPLFSDPDAGDVLTYALTSPPGAPVTVVSQGAGGLTVTAPLTAAAAETTIGVRATDRAGASADTTVTIRVVPSSVGPPVAVADTATTNQGEPVTVNVVANDRNTLGQGSLEVVGAFSQEGSATFSGANITFTPRADFFGTATVQYTITDERRTSEGEAIGLLTVTVIGRPSAPLNVNAAALPPRSIALTWQASTGNGAPILGYDVEVNGQVRAGASTGPSLTLSGLNPGEPYRFRVRAVNAAGEGEWSSLTPEVTVDEVPGPPGRPAVAIGGSGELAITWAVAPTEGSAVRSYEVELAQCGSALRSTSAPSYTWTGLENGVRCAFRVRAENLAGFGAYSPWSDLECPVGLPAAPARPNAERGDKQATISWTQPNNPDCNPMLGYELVRNPGGTQSVAAAVVQTVSAGLENGTSYQFQVRAQNRAGWSELSAWSNVVIPCGRPLAPPAPTAAHGDRQATVSRNGEAPANGCAVTAYQVQPSGGGWVNLPANGVVTGLTNGTSYTFRIRGVNEIGEGDPSPASNAVTPFGPPGPVVGLSMVNAWEGPNTWEGESFWVWQDADPNGSPVTSYQTSGNVSGEGPFGPMTANCRHPNGGDCWGGSTPGFPVLPELGCFQQAATVSASVWAVNAAGNGPARSATRNLGGCPSAPSASVSAGNGQFTVSWNRPANTQEIWLEINGGSSPVTGSSHTHAPATNGQSYNVAVYACNQFGCTRSALRTVTPVAPQPVVSASWGSRVLSSMEHCMVTQDECREIQFSWSNFPPNQSVTVECVNRINGSLVAWAQIPINTGSGSGSGNSGGRCPQPPGWQTPAYIRIDGVLSNGLN